MIRILANDGIDKTGQKLLEDAGFTVVTNKIPQENLAVELKNFDAVLVRSATKIRKDIMDACPNLRLIGRGGVGLDNIDVEHARKLGIKVINTPASSSISVAEMVFAHMFSMIRYLPMANRIMPAQGKERFNELKNHCSSGNELRGKTLGIIGFGRIGQEVARIGIGLGMEILAFDPFVESAEIYFYFPASVLDKRIKITIPTVSKERVLQNSDFLSFHIPFNQGDKSLINKAEMDKMKKGVGIVNCARGGVVNEKDLLEALNSGQVAFAGLDVFESEPPVYMDILNHPHVSLSPHIGGSTKEAQNRIGIELSDKIIEFFKNN